MFHLKVSHDEQLNLSNRFRSHDNNVLTKLHQNELQDQINSPAYRLQHIHIQLDDLIFI